MNTRKWHKGPPPHVGWWNASLARGDNIWRWWDGREWSWCVREDELISTAVFNANIKQSYLVSGISWSDYWPANARVPRIDPRKAK